MDQGQGGVVFLGQSSVGWLGCGRGGQCSWKTVLCSQCLPAAAQCVLGICPHHLPPVGQGLLWLLERH